MPDANWQEFENERDFRKKLGLPCLPLSRKRLNPVFFHVPIQLTLTSSRWVTSEVKFTTSVHGRSRLRSQQGRPWRLGHQSITVRAGFNLAGPKILRHWKPFGFIWTIKSILYEVYGMTWEAWQLSNNSAPACRNARLMCFLTGILLPDMLTQPHLSFQPHPQDSDLTMSDEDT